MDAIAIAEQVRALSDERYGYARASALVIYKPTAEFEPKLEELTAAYAEALPEDCAEIRTILEHCHVVLSFLLAYVYIAARTIKSDADTIWLRRGLAAASIENCSMDYRDMLLALSELHVLAERAGLDCQGEFERMAERSSPEMPRGGTVSMQKTLREFGHYAVLAERRQRQPHA